MDKVIIRKGTFSLQPTALGFKLQRSYPQLPYDKSLQYSMVRLQVGLSCHRFLSLFSPPPIQ